MRNEGDAGARTGYKRSAKPGIGNPGHGGVFFGAARVRVQPLHTHILRKRKTQQDRKRPLDQESRKLFPATLATWGLRLRNCQTPNSGLTVLHYCLDFQHEARAMADRLPLAPRIMSPIDVGVLSGSFSQPCQPWQGLCWWRDHSSLCFQSSPATGKVPFVSRRTFN